jgi:hypothetical protein
MRTDRRFGVSLLDWPAPFNAVQILWTNIIVLADWGIAALVASSVLVLEEARKLSLRGWRRLRPA